VSNQNVKELIQSIEWQDGKVFPIAEGPYRHRIVVHCSLRGRQKAMFANGERPYFCYLELFSGNGQWIKEGAGIVPVLPDNRLLMVVEQRPAQGRYPDRPMIAKIGGKDVNLRTFGEHSSLEFPGGAIDPDEGLKAGFLRELQEETGVQEQSAVAYSFCRPTYPFGSDIALRGYCHVVFLSGLSYQQHVATDGGLNVLALTPDEVQLNIWMGTIHSVQAALTAWSFYKEADLARGAVLFRERLLTLGYLKIEEIRIAKVK